MLRYAGNATNVARVTPVASYSSFIVIVFFTRLLMSHVC